MQDEKAVQKQMAAKLLEVSRDKVNRNIRDSVFCNLFGRPEYLIQLYQVLHPEDAETGPDDLTIVTLSRTFVREMYNDLGFMAGNILNQFITFCRVFEEQRKQYPGEAVTVVRETIRICREREVLADYLAGEEAATVMFTIADQEKAYNFAINEAKEEARKAGRAVGLAEGRAEGRAEGARERMEVDARGMFAEGLDPEVIARIQKVPVDEIRQILNLE